MDERKILLFILSLVIYSMYSVQIWFTKDVTAPENDITEDIPTETKENFEVFVDVENKTEIKRETKGNKIKGKVIPLYIVNACSVMDVFMEKPPVRYDNKPKEVYHDTNSVTMLGITIFLLVLVINAVLDVLKVKEEEQARRKLNPDGERRQSLAEFANKKPLRRGSSKFGFQLFQISESANNNGEEESKSQRQKQYRRGDSTNSYLSDQKKLQSEGSAPASMGDTSEPKLVKRQSVAKLFGARPVPMVRRSSFPALPLNPDVQAAMLGHRQQSVDSDDEGTGLGRRVRILRRF